MCAEARRFRGATVVFDQELKIRAVELGNRHFRGIAHGLAGDAGIARPGQRQNEAGFHLTGADRCRLRRLRALWRGS